MRRRCFLFFFSSRRRHTRCSRDWSSDVCSSDLNLALAIPRSINEQVEGSEFGAAANQDRANDWGTEERLHSVCHLLTNVFTPSYYSFMYMSFSLTCLLSTDLGISRGGLNRWCSLFRHMSQIIGYLFERPASFSRPMGKIMAQIMK